MPSSFFKIILDPSSCNLQLPTDFVSKHLMNKIPNSPIILSANGGYSWKLKIKQISDDGYCFSDGWNNVVKDSQLGFGDFLLFRPVDEVTFKLSIYSPNGCEKLLPPKLVGGDSGGGDDDHGNCEKNEDPVFTTIFARSHTKFLRFPGGFAELIGIDEEGTMMVKNLDGKEWVTGLKLDKSYRYMKRYFLSPGWACFTRENELSEGDECVFRFIRSEGKLLLAKVTKNKRSVPSGPVRKVAKRGRGRPEHQRGGDVDAVPQKSV
ncbi:B3 domain-containing protein REM8-like [Bidens hawaiensis]|uniref:B3 domain-containing protein REM8-like n=1 Tax=Bidens hawaiensis TaxID=980011 RepID=UPI00404A7427